MKTVIHLLLKTYAQLGPLKVIPTDKNRVVVAQSRVRSIFRLSYGMLILGFWYYLLLRTYRTNSELIGALNSPYFWLWLVGLIAPVYFAKKIIILAIGAVRPASFIFDRSTRSFSVGGKAIGQFEEIESIQVEEFEGDAASSFCLAIKMADGRIVDIESESCNGLNLDTVAKILAAHTGKAEVHLKR